MYTVSRTDLSSILQGRRSAMKNFLLGLVIGLVAVPLVFAVYILSGHGPAAATDSPMPLEHFLARGSLSARLRREAPKGDVSRFTTADLIAGANIYQKNCAFCHGLPDQPPSVAGRGMFPDAPQLFTADGMVTDDPAGVTYWKVENGIRLSGMPSFKSALTEDQGWQVSALLARADKLSPEVRDALKPVSWSTASTASSADSGQSK
jgi:thiosulfate dehydrogenase